MRSFRSIQLRYNQGQVAATPDTSHQELIAKLRNQNHTFRKGKSLRQDMCTISDQFNSNRIEGKRRPLPRYFNGNSSPHSAIRSAHSGRRRVFAKNCAQLQINLTRIQSKANGGHCQHILPRTPRQAPQSEARTLKANGIRQEL